MELLAASYRHNYDGTPIINLFGVGGERKAVFGFAPYFIVQFNEHISKAVALQLLHNSGFYNVTTIYRFEPIGYQTEKKMMFQVTLVSPKEIRFSREVAARIPNIFKVYESDILYVSRFLIDNNLGGFKEVPDTSPDKKALAFLSFDIEVLVDEEYKFPDANKDPIIIISMSIAPQLWGYDRIILTTKASDYKGCYVINCKDERELLRQFSFLVTEYNPDIVASFNGNNFDFPYIDKRCKILGVNFDLGRDGSRVWCRQRFDGNMDVIIPGRVVVDLLPIIRQSYSLSQYNLKTVASLVKMKKLDVSPREMREAYVSDNFVQWNKTIEYADRDAELVQHLLLDLKIIDKYAALSKASGLLLQDIINGGQSGMIEFMLMNEFRRNSRVMATRPIVDEETADDIRYEGATVLDPPMGLQENIIILDFRALYPTLIMSHNISYDTLDINNLCKYEEVETSPSNARFIKRDIYKGIMPQILEGLLEERIATKKAMKRAETPAEKDYLGAKQNAMKILLNSFYGYAGYLRARLFTIEVAESVTSFGRVNIQKTIDLINNEGYEVLYGDTDSVFVKSNLNDMKEIKKLGDQLAAKATEMLPKPMELVFEAVAKRALFLAKKRYAMWRFEPTNDGWSDKIKAKGIETVRRDWCPIVGKTVSKVLEMILKNGDIEGAFRYAYSIILDIKLQNIDLIQNLDDLILSKKYSKSEYKMKPVHVQLVERIIARGEEPPQLGDRVQFIIVNEYGKQFSKSAETVDYARSHNLTLNSEYYMSKQILPPLIRIFEMFDINEDMLKRGIYKKSINSKQKSLFDL